MKNSKLNLSYVMLLICITMFLFSGCSWVDNILNIFTTSYYEEYNLKILSGANCSTYIFSDKTMISIDGNLEDNLEIITNKNDDGTYNTEKILIGEFEKFGYYDDKIFLYTNNNYYVFDITSYDIDEYNRTKKYPLLKYSENEFLDEYEDCKKIDWEL